MIRKGDVVIFKPEWQDPGDANIVFRAISDEEKGRVDVLAKIDVPIQPIQTVTTDMIAEVKRDDREST